MLSASLPPLLHALTQDFNGYRRRRFGTDPIIHLIKRLCMLEHVSSGGRIFQARHP